MFENELEYDILRGENKIGENLIEVGGYDKRVLLECGKALFPDEKTEVIERIVQHIDYDAIVLSHAHPDHCGLLTVPLAAKAIYMGENTFKILNCKHAICEENAAKIQFMKSEQPFFIGEIRFVPHLCDHSCLDSYMIEISDNVKTILYTGDFRSNGRKCFDALLKRLPQKVDVLISEKTLSAEKNETEWDLERQAIDIMKKHNEIFVLQSSVNIDRLVSFYRASKQSDAVFLMSNLQSKIVEEIKNIPNPKEFSDCYVYFSKKPSELTYSEFKEKYGQKLIGREQIAEIDKFTMLISSSMADYLTKLAEKRDLSDAVFIYSLWDGYKENMDELLKTIEKLNIASIDLHVTGHADANAIEALIKRTNPTEIKFVHTDKKNEDK